MLKIIFIFIAGGMGVLSRYGVYELSSRMYSGNLPLGTFLVNLIGSFFIGFLWGIFESKDISPEFRGAIFVGFLGGFTTFSSFKLDSMLLIKGNQVLTAVMYIVLSNALGILFVFLGYFTSQIITAKLFK